MHGMLLTESASAVQLFAHSPCLPETTYVSHAFTSLPQLFDAVGEKSFSVTMETKFDRLALQLPAHYRQTCCPRSSISPKSRSRAARDLDLSPSREGLP